MPIQATGPWFQLYDGILRPSLTFADVKLQDMENQADLGN